ncbi:DUF1810 domain-containing protein [Hymenobacter psychrophilus]|uniref:Uncharacterized protein, DUF1810 family n=1 Tax=Hymenobacter psychrophilus TaxID=651662 RepID=A0A1H3D7A4_9BACT|nr:DUF1810 domain-containing protein [Hymenobacter psychrophilus]SDX62402.1 Uncharacterized protein, DUF1810 family [Hymenobacter psychrophilus]
MPTLQRFLDAQKSTYETALTEIQSGRKRSHWMWFIFPQLQGLGLSETARFYAIRDAREAAAYLAHPVLGLRLETISGALLALDSADATRIFGSPDDVKLRSSMTLFRAVPGAAAVFGAVLERFYEGQPDAKTVALLNK